MKHIMDLTLTITALGLLAGCGVSNESAPMIIGPVPAAFTATLPEGTPIPIPEARTQVKPGDPVMLVGKVMGVRNPFVDGRGVFVIGDESTLTSCDLMGDEGHCPTPWDACCDSPEERKAGTATIQVVDADGQVLAQGLKGVAGLNELSQVRIAGIVAPQATADALIVNAQAIYVVP